MRVAVNLEQLLHAVPGGIGRYTARVARLLPSVNPGDEVVGFVARHPRAAVQAVADELGLAETPVVSALPRPLLYDAWHLLGRPRLRLDADLVHAPSLAVPPPAPGQPLVVTVHDAAPVVHPETYTRRGRWFHRRGLDAAARRADLVIAPSAFAAEEVASHSAVPRSRIRVVLNGVDAPEVAAEEVERVRRARGLDDRPYVLWVGTQEPRKNLGLLVAAFAAAVAGHPGLPHLLVLAGAAGWLHQDPTTLAGAGDVGDRLRVLGPPSDAELYALYRGADVLALPSRHEGFGLPALEAMAQGTAVVCTDAGALPEVTAGAARLAGLDVGSFGQALAGVLLDDGARAELAEAGRRRAGELSWERCVRETRAVYEEAASR